MKAVELHYDINDTVSLGMRETEKVHILRRHSHQIDEIMRFRRLEEIAMTRGLSCELSGTEIEIRVLGELLKVRVEAKETRYLNHKHKVEVGRSRNGCIVPLEAVLDEIV